MYPQAMIAKSAAPRFEALDSLRGICAVMVVLFHLNATGVINHLPIVRNSWLFVDFFFVLSGFVIASGYQEKLAAGFPLRRFMFLRLARVYPLHILVLLLWLAMETGKYFQALPGVSLHPPFTQPRSIGEFWEATFLVQIFAQRDDYGWNAPAWSIAAEVWAYLLAGVVLARAGRHVVPIAIAAIITALIVLVIAGRGSLYEIYGFALPRCLLGFSCGLIARNLYRHFGPFHTTTAIELGVVVGIIAFVSLAAGYATLAAPFMFMAAVVVFATERGRVSAILRLKPFLLIGTLSYSIYMVHMFVLSRCLDVLLVVARKTRIELAHVSTIEGGALKVVGSPEHHWLGDVLTVGIVGVCIAAAWLTFHWVEEPFRKWSKRKVASAAAAAEQAPVAF